MMTQRDTRMFLDATFVTSVFLANPSAAFISRKPTGIVLQVLLQPGLTWKKKFTTI